MHENGPFYYSDSDEDLGDGDGDVIDEVRREEEVDHLKYVDLGQELKRIVSLTCSFLVKSDT